MNILQKNTPTVVITSIFNPTEAVRRFANLKDWQLIVVADNKTPTNWEQQGAYLLSVDEQRESDLRISARLPWNHYCRKLLGYLYAIRAGAPVIYDTDDDNLPQDNWHLPPFDGDYATSQPDLGFVNIYASFTEQHIWPRGFPLEQILDPQTLLLEEQLSTQPIRVGVWQGLADGDPDVDAIYRLTLNKPCIFRRRPPIALDQGTFCPYNSQNTFYRPEFYALLYLPAFVTFRFTDILRGLVAQPILTRLGYRLGFLEATVFQERNPHNYLRDFESEIPCYLHPQKILELVDRVIDTTETVENNLGKAYEALCVAGIVPPEELVLLRAWLDDLADCVAMNY
jgi:STELLO glycosyltransferases